jgi:hypothetical protein
MTVPPLFGSRYKDASRMPRSRGSALLDVGAVCFFLDATCEGGMAGVCLTPVRSACHEAGGLSKTCRGVADFVAAAIGRVTSAE